MAHRYDTPHTTHARGCACSMVHGLSACSMDSVSDAHDNDTSLTYVLHGRKLCVATHERASNISGESHRISFPWSDCTCDDPRGACPSQQAALLAELPFHPLCVIR